MNNTVRIIIAFCVVLAIAAAFSAGWFLAGSRVQPELITAPAGVYTPDRNTEYAVGADIFQLSGENRAQIMQAYSIVFTRVEQLNEYCEDEENSDWTLTTGSDGEKLMSYKGRRVAVVTDVDETLLDNSAYYCNALLNGEPTDDASFLEFQRAGGGTALPNSVKLMNFLADSGIEIYYLAERSNPDTDADTYDLTLEQLETLGYPVDDMHLILLDPASATESREDARTAIEAGLKLSNGRRVSADGSGERTRLSLKKHHVVLTLGDSLSDFSADFADAELNAVSRAKLAEKYAPQFGKEWVLVPNAMTGEALDGGIRYGVSALFRALRPAEARTPVAVGTAR